MQDRKKFLASIVIVYIALFGVIVSSFRDYGISWDEAFYRDIGTFYAQHYWDGVAINQRVKAYDQQTHGALVDVLYYLPLHWWGNEESFEDVHLVKALFGSLTLVIVALTLRTLGIRWWLAIGGMFLLATQPRWWGDLFDNFMDISAGMLAALQLLVGVWTIRGHGKTSQRVGLTLSAAIGAIGFSHRPVLGVVLAAETCLLIGAWRRHHGSWKRVMVNGSLLAFIFFVVLSLADPYVRMHGIGGLYQKVFDSMHIPHHGGRLFEGKYVFSEQLPWYYVPKWIAITTPLPILALALIGSIALVKRMLRREDTGAWGIVLVSGWIPIVITMIVHVSLYDAWRHFLWVIVPMTLIAVYGMNSLAKFVSPRRGAHILFFGFIVYVVLLIHTMWQLHPYEYLYFNALVGGLRGAAGRYETDYWGKTNREAVLWLRDHELASQFGTYRIETCGSPRSSTYYFNEKMTWVPLLSDADYFVCFTRNTDYNQMDDRDTIHAVMRLGVPLNYVRKIP